MQPAPAHVDPNARLVVARRVPAPRARPPAAMAAMRAGSKYTGLPYFV